MATEQDWDDFFSEMKDYVQSKFEEKKSEEGKETAPSPGKKDDAPTPPEPPKNEKESPKKRRWGFFPEES